MRWTPGYKSDDVLDRRGQRAAGLGGGLLQLAPLLLRTRYGWVVLLLIIAGGYFGGLFRGSDDSQRAASAGGSSTDAPKDQPAQFVSFVLDDVQATWERELAPGPRPYRHAKLVLFTDAVDTACGFGQSATGPFYCPRDERVYIDLGFYQELARRFGANGDFAQAYVIAHEVGHHVQKILGLSAQDQDQGSSHVAQEGAGSFSVRMELQADCYAGVWAHSTQQRQLLESGDLAEAMTAAAAIGDDRLQRKTEGMVHPESWTHGSSAQRARWLRRGYEQGNRQACDTFGAKAL